MQVTINVDDNMFSEVASKELAALKSEDIKEIIVQCLGEYLRKDDYKNISQLIVLRESPYGREYFTPLMNDMIQHADYSKLQDIVDACIAKMKTEYAALLQNALTEALVGGLANSYGMQQAMKDAAHQMLWQDKYSSQ